MKAPRVRTVYFVKPMWLDGPIKIGCSYAPSHRLMTLAAWSPFPLELIGAVPGSYADEKFLHECFADVHSHHEWFRSTPSLRAAVAAVLSAGAVDVLRATHSSKGSIRSPYSRRVRTPEESKYFSYASRINWAARKLRRVDEYGAWWTPADVEKIMSRWRDSHGTPPLASDLARLEEFLANPAAHSVIPNWRKPPIAAPSEPEKAAS